MIVVDRIEENIIICQNLDNNKILNINIKEFEFKPKEGDVCYLKNSKYYINKDETLKRKEYIKKICDNIFE